MTTLGDALRRLRQQRRNMSQAELAEAAGLGVSTIKRLEADDAGRETKRSTLMQTARGLAKDYAGNVDPDVVETIYADLLVAAGIVPPGRVRPGETIDPDASRDAFIREMETRTGRRDLALALSTVGWHYHEIPEHLRTVIATTIIELAGARDSPKNE